MHPRVQSAALPAISCFAPHMASLTSPVKVWFLPAASAGTAASPTNICIPRIAAAIRCTFIVIFVSCGTGCGAKFKKWILRIYHDVNIGILAQALGCKIFVFDRPTSLALLLPEMDLHVHGLVLRVRRFMNAHSPVHPVGKELFGISQKLLQIVGVVSLTFVQSPRRPHAGCRLRVP